MEGNPQFLVPPSSRFIGVVDQFLRLRWLLRSAAKHADEATRFRMLILAVYPARAITEIMLEAAAKQELEGLKGADVKKNRDTFEQKYLIGLPHYLLIEKIRIHDFHRFGCVPGNGIHFGGPIKLTASKGDAGIQIPLHGAGGKVIVATGESKVEEQRTLLQSGSNFWDELSKSYLSLDQILVPYFEAIEPVITTFQSLIGATAYVPSSPQEPTTDLTGKQSHEANEVPPVRPG